MTIQAPVVAERDGRRSRDGSRSRNGTAAIGQGHSVSALAEAQVRVHASPLLTVTGLLYETAGNPMGSPRRWTAGARASLEQADMSALHRAFGPDGSRFTPLCLLSSPGRGVTSLDEEVEHVATVAPDVLAGEIADYSMLRSAWAEVARHPRQWLNHYVQALRRAWVFVEPMWVQATPLLEREVERVGRSVVSGGLPLLLDGLAERSRVELDQWYLLDSTEPSRVAPGLCLEPIVIGRRALVVQADPDGVVRQVGYPLPGAVAIEQSSGPDRRPDALGSLIGAARASVLRMLDQPRTAGHLARTLLYSPSSITHHLAGLERSGLVRRERRGRSVVVHRTARGTQLLHLYD